ncbi:tspO MBR family domain-containing [Pyrrhoderma noxium]|uniref:TspO MBR family domain-containing n=1 Tax=Pyrrhoderma noxium TaxID=2282107 RepID=A0A286UML9_9AGAM|nr:tspO MBR family domain-containing [Pyrrhoderma noxium]
MEYIPKHKQPFTFAQALELDIPEITQEISRLENSLAHLNHTQIFLREHISEEHGEEDQGLTDALKENDEVIASQKERITILKLVLEEKGVNTKSAHYSATPGSVPNIGSVDSERRQQPAENNFNTTPTTTTDGRALTNRGQVTGVGADGDGDKTGYRPYVEKTPTVRR